MGERGIKESGVDIYIIVGVVCIVEWKSGNRWMDVKKSLLFRGAKNSRD